MCSDRASLTFRLQSWSQMGNHRMTWKILHRSSAAKEFISLRSVGAALSTVVVCAGKTLHLNIYSVYSGVKSADRIELAKIASQPSQDFSSFVGDFKVLNTLLPLVSPRVCFKAGGVYASDGRSKVKSQLFCWSQAFIEFLLFCFPEAFSGPSNLQFSDQTSDSLSFGWSEAGGPVNTYVVQYVPLSGLGQPITAELRQVSPKSLVFVHHRRMEQLLPAF